jgi:hypothetical protein
VTVDEAYIELVLALRHWTAGGDRKNHTCKCEECRAIKQVCALAREAIAKKQKPRGSVGFPVDWL